MKKLFAALILILMLISCSDVTNTDSIVQSSPSPSTTVAKSSKKIEYINVKARVIRVVDGDTIEVNLDGKNTTFRLLLVDTPETKKPRTKVQPYGPEASVFVKDLVMNKEVDLEIQSGLDKYGRGLAYVSIEGKSVQERLLEKGLARVAYIYIKNPPHLDEYLKVEKIAKDAKLNIWSIPDYVQKDGFHPEVIVK